MDADERRAEVLALKAWLRARVEEAEDSQEALAKTLDVSTRTIRNSLSDKAGFGGATTYLLLRLYGGVTFESAGKRTIHDRLAAIETKIDGLLDAEIERSGSKTAAEDAGAVDRTIHDLLYRVRWPDDPQSPLESAGGSVS